MRVEGCVQSSKVHSHLNGIAKRWLPPSSFSPSVALNEILLLISYYRRVPIQSSRSTSCAEQRIFEAFPSENFEPGLVCELSPSNWQSIDLQQ